MLPRLGLQEIALTEDPPLPRQGFRRWLQEHQAVAATLALLVTGLSIYYAIHHARPHNEATFDFIDDETGKPSVHSINEVPPLIGDSGKPTVVRAVFTSGRDGSERTLLYLEK